MFKIRVMICTLIALLVTSCSASGSKKGNSLNLEEELQIQSIPPGAEITLSTGESCTTPCSIVKKKGTKITLKAKKVGYEDKAVEISTKLPDSSFADSLKNMLGPTDERLSQARFSPNPINIQLIPTWTKD